MEEYGNYISAALLPLLAILQPRRWKLFIQMDIGNRIFEEALQKIGEYLKDLTENTRVQAETAKFQNMLETLCSFSRIAVWETDLSILNAKIEKTFQDYENAVSQYARTVGENFADYLKEKENAAEKLRPLGYDDDMFEEFVSKIERNVEMLGKISRLERSELWKKADSSL